MGPNNYSKLVHSKQLFKSLIFPQHLFQKKCKQDRGFNCANGNKCIPMKSVCDGHIDCDDKSDEYKNMCKV